MEMTIRKATEKDIPAVAEIFSNIHTAEEEGTVTIGWIRAVYPTEATARAALERGDLFVMEDEGKLVGTAVNEILEITVDAMTHDDNEKAKSIEPLEETIDDMVLVLRDRHTQRLKAGTCSVTSGLVFMESMTHLERAADHCSSIAVMMLARHDDNILHDHHEYLRELHAGTDEDYRAERKRRREQYLKPLKEIQ